MTMPNFLTTVQIRNWIDEKMIPVEVREPFNRLCCCFLRESPLIDNNEFVAQPTRVGSSILICGRRKSRFPFQCLVGPDWPIVLVVYALIVGIDGLVLWIVSPLGWVPVLIGTVTCIILLYFYSSVACSDPGIIYKNDFTSLKESTSPCGMDIESCADTSHKPHVHSISLPRHANQLLAIPDTMDCGQCDLKRPVTARHCVHCETCIDELDHHCPWYVCM
jgi:hypothetical protein